MIQIKNAINGWVVEVYDEHDKEALPKIYLVESDDHKDLLRCVLGHTYGYDRDDAPRSLQIFYAPELSCYLTEFSSEVKKKYTNVELEDLRILRDTLIKMQLDSNTLDEGEEHA
jgi:uncharacterized protein (DUF1800 family)